MRVAFPKREKEMRSLVLTVGLVAIAGVAFAGEPQKSTTQQQPVVESLQQQSSTASLRAPQKMTDEQLGNVIAGSNETNQVYLFTTGHGMTAFCQLPGQSLNGFRGQGGSSAQGYYCFQG
jgi:hypothetical protein